MLNRPVSNLQINDGQHRPPQPTIPGMRPVQSTMAPTQGSARGNFRSDQQSPLRQFTPIMATGITPPTTGTSSQPQYPGPGAHSQGLPNGKVIAYCIQIIITHDLYYLCFDCLLDLQIIIDIA